MTILIIIFAVVLFNLIIFIHEFGHFFAAKSFGVKVNEFAIGMGPKIFKIKKGGTLYSFRLFPIGGFCEMEGEDEESTSERSFGKKEVWKRIIIVALGGIMNIVLGFLMIFFLSCQKSGFASSTISKFDEDSVSDKYGLTIGDEITSINGYKIYSYKDMFFALLSDKNNVFDINVKRNGSLVELKDVKFGTFENSKGQIITKIDFSVDVIEKNFFTILKQTLADTLSTVRIIWSTFIGLFTGRFKINEMVGPVGMASAIGSATSEGLKISKMYAIKNVIDVMAVITVNLGVLNLLPLPALDGGRLVFLFSELIFGKSISSKHEGWIHAAGLFMFFMLIAFITYSDIVNIIKR